MNEICLERMGLSVFINVCPNLQLLMARGILFILSSLPCPLSSSLSMNHMQNTNAPFWPQDTTCHNKYVMASRWWTSPTEPIYMNGAFRKYSCPWTFSPFCSVTHTD